MFNILLTGASGFIGSNILNKIKLENKVFVIQRKKAKIKIKKDKNINVIEFNNFESLDKKLKKIRANVIIHCATHYKKNHELKDIEKFNQSNILLGNIILENLQNLKAKKFINFTTTWEAENGQMNNPKNLYAAYKSSFNCLLEYYKKQFPKVKFIELVIVDTFGKNDNRQKIINTLKKNYNTNKITKIISKRLYLNLINVVDIVDAVKLIIDKNYKSGKYILKNHNFISILKLINFINKNSIKKIKVKWLSRIKMRDKFFKYKKLKNWKPKKSSIVNIKDLILNN